MDVAYLSPVGFSTQDIGYEWTVVGLSYIWLQPGAVTSLDSIWLARSGVKNVEGIVAHSDWLKLLVTQLNPKGTKTWTLLLKYCTLYSTMHLHTQHVIKVQWIHLKPYPRYHLSSLSLLMLVMTSPYTCSYVALTYILLQEFPLQSS